MSPTERKRMSRLKMLMRGDVEVTVRIRKDALIFIDKWATARNQSRTHVIHEFLMQSVERAHYAYREAQKLLEFGMSDDDAEAFVKNCLEAPEVSAPIGRDDDNANGGIRRP